MKNTVTVASIHLKLCFLKEREREREKITEEFKRF